MSNALAQDAELFHSYYRASELQSYIRENPGVRHIFVPARLTYDLLRWVQIGKREAQEMLVTLPANTLLPAEFSHGVLWLGR